MSSLNDQVKEAIDSFDMPRARELLRDALKQADAETYYLASRVALDDEQKRDFLEKAVALDPFHEKARAALKALSGNTSDKVISSTQYTQSAPSASPRSNYAPSGPSPISSNVEKPKNTPISEYQHADTRRRLVAYAIDTFIFLLITDTITKNLFDRYTSQEVVYVVTAVLYVCFNIAYHIGFSMIWGGQTPGKRIMKLRVIRKDGGTMTLSDGIMRFLVGYTISYIPLGLGFLWGLFDANRETWHDKISKTVVVVA